MLCCMRRAKPKLLTNLAWEEERREGPGQTLPTSSPIVGFRIEPVQVILR